MGEKKPVTRGYLPSRVGKLTTFYPWVRLWVKSVPVDGLRAGGGYALSIAGKQ